MIRSRFDNIGKIQITMTHKRKQKEKNHYKTIFTQNKTI